MESSLAPEDDRALLGNHVNMPPIQAGQGMCEPSVSRWRAMAAWMVIAACVAFFAVMAVRVKAQEATHATRPGLQREIMAKYAMGLKQFGLTQQKSTLDSLAGSISAEAHTPEEQVRAAILMGELKGRAAAEARLVRLGKAQSEEVQTDVRVLERMYETDPVLGMDAKDTARMERRHGWVGELAAVFGRPEADKQRQAVLYEATKTTVILLGVAIAGLGGVLLGVAGLITAIVLLAKGKLTAAFLAAPRDVASTAMLEGFALYLLLMAGMNLLGDKWRLPGLLRYLPLLALPPVVLIFMRWRGAGWGEMGRRAGWTTGRGVLREVACGIGGYFTALPLVVVGMVITALLAKAVGMDATHPIVESAANATAMDWVMLWLLACVWAPITEEFMFRGVLFCWMRGRWGWWASAAVVSLIFAALHPQGWVAIPLLGTLAMALAALRQWRGSLIASMTTHAMTNGITMAILMALLS